MEVLNVAGLRKTRDGGFVLGDISFVLHEREFLGLLGRNGAGKTTLLRLIAGLVPPSSGTVSILGHEPKMIKHLSEYIGVVHQHSALPDYLTVVEFLTAESRLRKGEPGTIRQLIDLAGLGAHQNSPIAVLSQGTARKVAIVRALLHRPRVLLLDEPTVGLDPVVRNEIWKTMLALKEQNVAAIIATNDPYEAELLCDGVLFIEQGRMTRQSSMASLRSTGPSVREAILSALGAPSYSSADPV